MLIVIPVGDGIRGKERIVENKPGHKSHGIAADEYTTKAPGGGASGF
jgi:hypothetical protein